MQQNFDNINSSKRARQTQRGIAVLFMKILTQNVAVGGNTGKHT
jgi:hypothetical protein